MLPMSHVKTDNLLMFGISHIVYIKLLNFGITAVRSFKTFDEGRAVFRYEFLKGAFEVGSVIVPMDDWALKTACEKYAKTL